jgi:hypothetical protein
MGDGYKMERFFEVAGYVVTWPLLIIEWFEMRATLVGQDFVQHREVKAMFPGYYPVEVFEVLSAASSKPGTTRKDVLRALRQIAADHKCGARFAKALDPDELASLD